MHKIIAARCLSRDAVVADTSVVNRLVAGLQA
jgi:hypothetical protein